MSWKRFYSTNSYNQTMIDITGEDPKIHPDLGGLVYATNVGYIVARLLPGGTELMIATGRTTFETIKIEGMDMIDLERAVSSIGEKVFKLKGITAATDHAIKSPTWLNEIKLKWWPKINDYLSLEDGEELVETDLGGYTVANPTFAVHCWITDRGTIIFPDNGPEVIDEINIKDRSVIDVRTDVFKIALKIMDTTHE